MDRFFSALRGFGLRPVGLRRFGARLGTRFGRGRQQVRDDAQSLAFAADLCHHLRCEWHDLRSDLRLTLLDVGARTGTGSDLIERAFHPDSWSRLKLRVTAVDIDPFYRERVREELPSLDYRVADVMDLRGQWDIVTCSHTLEHLADPRPMMRQLLALARRQVIIAAPWQEPLDARPEYHLFQFDKAFFDEFPPTRFETYRSPQWHSSRCFIASYRLDAVEPKNA